MEPGTSFEVTWPALERQLRDALARRRVPADFREDVLQETALRLLRNWDRVRPESMWAFALTVALNVVRDEARRKERRDRTILDTPIVDRDPEHEALIRLELERVRTALASMSERQRLILLSEVGEARVVEPSTPSLKMARMRARRRLRALIEDASGYALLPVLRTRRWLQAADVGVANTAASFAVQIAAIIALSGSAVPAFNSTPENFAAPAAVQRAKTASTPVQASSAGGLSIVRGEALRPSLSTRYFALDRSDDADLNENFGFVRKEGDSLIVGDEAQVGPYGAEHTVTQTVAGSRVVAEIKARYDAAECVNQFLSRPHSPCIDPGRVQGRLRTAIESKEHTAAIDTGDIN